MHHEGNITRSTTSTVETGLFVCNLATMLLDYGAGPIAIVALCLLVAVKLLFADRPDHKKVICQTVAEAAFDLDCLAQLISVRLVRHANCRPASCCNDVFETVALKLRTYCVCNVIQSQFEGTKSLSELPSPPGLPFIGHAFKLLGQQSTQASNSAHVASYCANWRTRTCITMKLLMRCTFVRLL
jgi:hypothetical protein